MKWKLAIIGICYVVGAGFLVAWKIEADKIAMNPPNGVFNINPIMWMMKTGCIFLFIGSTVLTNLISRPVGRLLFSSDYGNGRGIICWFIFGIFAGGVAANALQKVWGVWGGTLFGVSLGMIIVTIGYLESKSSENSG